MKGSRGGDEGCPLPKGALGQGLDPQSLGLGSHSSTARQTWASLRPSSGGLQLWVLMQGAGEGAVTFHAKPSLLSARGARPDWPQS